MVMIRQKTLVCKRCGTSFSGLGVPKKDFLGFPKHLCPKCKRITLEPLSAGYRVSYWLLVISLVGAFFYARRDWGGGWLGAASGLYSLVELHPERVFGFMFLLILSTWAIVTDGMITLSGGGHVGGPQGGEGLEGHEGDSSSTEFCPKCGQIMKGAVKDMVGENRVCQSCLRKFENMGS
jgi:hypothetical protein